MHIFYSTNIHGNRITLDEGESTHCLRVLRLSKGDHVQVIDGLGNLYDAVIRNPDLTGCELEITTVQKMPPQRDFNLHIAIAPTKSIDRFEWFIEKTVEIGIDTITPLLCQRSERHVIKTERLQKLIISTMKQAMITRLPVLNELSPFKAFTASCPPSTANCFIAHCNEPDRKLLQHQIIPHMDVTIMIGPEGDFTPEEINLAVNSGVKPVSLGPNRLRTETAGIVACNIINAVFK